MPSIAPTWLSFSPKALPLRPGHLKILWVLAQRSETTHLSLQILCTREETVGKAIDVQLCLLRKKLPSGATIESIHGWGYRLVIESDVEAGPA